MKRILSTLLIILAFGFYQSQTTLNAQAYKFSVDEPTGGSGNQSSDSGDEGLYIAAGIVVAAIVGYALYKKFKKSDEDDDSSSTASTALNRLIEKEKSSFAYKLNEFREKIPVELYFGVAKQNFTIPERTYSVGIAYKF